MIRKFLAAATTHTLGDREVVVIASTDSVDRAGEIVEVSGIDLSAFRTNPIILWNHDPAHPVGTATSVSINSGKLRATVEFAGEGLSKTADETCNLVKAGIVSGVSIGFDPVETEPMNASIPRGPLRYVKSELLEISFVSIAANVEAQVVQRALRGNTARANIATLHRRWNAMRLVGPGPSYEERLAEVRRTFNIGPAAVVVPLSYAERQAQLEALSPPMTQEELHLCDVAAGRGEILTRARVDMIVREARACGQTATQRYLWCETAARWGARR